MILHYAALNSNNDNAILTITKNTMVTATTTTTLLMIETMISKVKDEKEENKENGMGQWEGNEGHIDNDKECQTNFILK